MTGSARFTVPTIFTASDKFTPVIRRMGGVINGFVAKSQVGLASVQRGFRRLLTPVTALHNTLRGMGYYVGIFTLIFLLNRAIDVYADFEQAQVNISTVTGKAVSQNQALANQARILALKYGEAATGVSQLQYELIKMGNTEIDVLKMTPAILTGAVALQTTPDELSKQVGAIMKTFPKLRPADTGMIIDMMAKIADITALDAPTLFEMLPRVSIYASKAGLEFQQMLAIFGALKDAMLPVQSSATGFKNILIDSQIAGKDYAKQLEKITSSTNELKKAYKLFGRKTATSALVLAGAQEENVLDRFVKTLESKKTIGYAETIATQRLDTFRGTAKLAKTSYQEFILSIEDGRGKYALLLKDLNRTIAAMFLLSSGTDEAKSTLEKMNPKVIETAQKYLRWLKIIGYVTAAIILLRIAILLWQAVVISAQIFMVGFNIILGITGALSATAAIAIGQSTVALTAYKIALWAANAAMAANPIGLIIIGIAALIGWITLVIKKWNKWGAAILFITSPLGIIVSAIQSFRRNWESIKMAFKEKGFLNGIIAIGNVIFDALLMPIQQLLVLVHRFTGWKWAENSAKSIERLRQNLGVNLETTESGSKRVDINKQLSQPSKEKSVDAMKRLMLNPMLNDRDRSALTKFVALREQEDIALVNPEMRRQEALRDSIQTSIEKQTAELTIRDQTGRAEVTKKSNVIPMRIESTMAN